MSPPRPDPAADRATWKSAGKPGRTKVGTLFGIAKEHGFEFTDAASMQTPAQGGPIVADRLRAEKARERELEEARYRERADKAARDAVDLWAGAHDTGDSAYLRRKGVRPHGVRFLADGTVLVPMRDPSGVLQNLQRIAAEPPAAGAPEKRYLPGGRKTGMWHWCGDPSGADVLAVAEGYATAASIHESTGRPVAVAFDAGNLVHVTKALRALYPNAPLVVCGDDDAQTAARTGKNPGRDKATAAARAAANRQARAACVFPNGLPEGGTDFNDLAAHAGIEAVRSAIEEACQALLCETSPETAESGAGAPKQSTAGRGIDLSAAKPAGADDGPGDWDPFSVGDEGVWHTARDAEGNLKKPQWLCRRLLVEARTRADDLNGWGYLLKFDDPDGNPKTWAMPSAMLSGDGSEWAGRLRDMGLRMAPGTQSRNLVARYIDTRNPVERVTCTDRVGWHGSVFVLPSGAIGTAESRSFVFQSDSGMEDTFRQRGALDDWLKNVGRLCVGNSRLLFAVCCALAGPALRPAGMESGGFHLRGNSSIGKTTGLKVAASVWGRPTYMQRWRTTDNALEATAVQHCDGLLILDEIGQVDGRVLGECAYMLANGQEKGRATRNGQPRKKRTWQLLYLSAGEVSMADHMAEAGKRTRAGQEVRMLDIPLDAGRGMGGIEEIHGYDGPAAVSEAIVDAAAAQYGTCGRAWLEWLCANHATLTGRLQSLVEEYRDQMVPEAASEQVRRAGNRFALVAAAGELATSAGVTGWLAGQAAWGVRQCFNAWLAARGHLDNGEDASMQRQVRQFIEAHGEARFTWWHRAMDDHAPKTMNRVGFRRLIGGDGKPIKSNSDHTAEFGERMGSAAGETAQVEYIILREEFRREVCRGFDPEAVMRLLQRRGHLVHERDRLTNKHRLPGIGMTSCVHIKPSLMEDDL